jgi:PHD/YefM family antitoxin component YafN of YafNO toxin-antitoxin module
METARVRASEFLKAFGALRRSTRREPVIMMEQGQDDLGVMSAEECERLRRRDRRVGLTSELLEEWLEAARQAKVPDEFAELDDELK